MALPVFGRRLRVQDEQSGGGAFQEGVGANCAAGSVNSYVGLPLPAYSPAEAAVMRLTEFAAISVSST